MLESIRRLNGILFPLPRLMNLKKIYGFNEPFRFTGSSTGRWAVRIINNQYPQNQMSDCLN
ncbi:hypothetical protein FMR91_22420 [Escherichia coli]|nr:hypothetical protein [Escherichia coli]